MDSETGSVVVIMADMEVSVVTVGLADIAAEVSDIMADLVAIGVVVLVTLDVDSSGEVF